MKVEPLSLNGALLIEPKVFGDSRGFFFEFWNEAKFLELGFKWKFVQDNISLSSKGVLRGLHFQKPKSQAKLVSVLQGEVFDVMVDLREDSPTFKQWAGIRLSAENHRQIFIPEGFAHGFQVLSEAALVVYKCTEFYDASCEHVLRWDNPELHIDWPIAEPKVSRKDSGGNVSGGDLLIEPQNHD